MLEFTQSDKKILSEIDTLIQLVGKIVIAVKSGGFRFSARLIEVRGSELWFENRSGQRWMARRDDVAYLAELPASRGQSWPK
jgi:hypothetical protein